MVGAADAEPWLEGLVEVARVGRPHGKAGELSVHAFADEPENLLRAELVYLDAWPGTIAYRVESAQCIESSADRTGQRSGAGSRVRLKLARIDTRERAEIWTGARLFLAESALREPEPGEHYLRDLIGLRCVTVDGIELGRVREIWPVPDCDQMLVEGPHGELFVPASDEVLCEVDPAAQCVRVMLPEGFLEPGDPGASGRVEAGRSSEEGGDAGSEGSGD